jgi:mRNA interferase HigB
VRIISKRTLRSFWTRHAGAQQALCAWFHEVENAEWKTPTELKTDFPSADILPRNRVVFNIKGNHYRLIAKVHYNTGILFVRFIGTHSEYDHVDATNI